MIDRKDIKEVMSPDVTEGTTKGNMAARLIADLKVAVNQLTQLERGSLEEELITTQLKHGADVFSLERGDYSVLTPSIWDSLTTRPPVEGVTSHIRVRCINNNKQYGLIRMCAIIETGDVWVSTRPLAPSVNSEWSKWLQHSDVKTNSDGVVFDKGYTPVSVVLNNNPALSDDRDWNVAPLTKQEITNPNISRVGGFSPKGLFDAVEAHFISTLTVGIDSGVLSLTDGLNSLPEPVTEDDTRVNDVTPTTDGIMTQLDAVKIGSVQKDAQKNPPIATTSKDGLFSKADKSKLDGVEEGAEVNPPLATQNREGLVSRADQAKIDSLEEGANVNPNPTSYSVDGLITKQEIVKLNSIEIGAQVNPQAATTESDGLLSEEDKIKLDELPIHNKVFDITTITGNITLGEQYNGMTLYVKNDVKFTLRDYNGVSDNWWMKIINTDSYVVTIETINEMVVGSGKTKLTSGATIIKSKVQNTYFINETLV